ncbi:MAG: tRNA (guanine-N(1)-)-methyltransferase [Chlamydiia bacterium]|nr:tRNA (guanine-N(1)-)-methyltransferase [Chlamydiia bacterium]
MKFDILSLFPEYFDGPLDCSIIGRARENGLIDVDLVNIRDFATDKHRRVDDPPYGGGCGMVMMPGPVVDAVESIKDEGKKVIYLTPQGTKLTASKCEELAREDHLVIICGHYEGIDQRAIDEVVDEEISIGDYVLTSGCAAALVLLDSVCRFVPGVLGSQDSPYDDSFHRWEGFKGPLYTRPKEFRGQMVPDVLMSGDHKKIRNWRDEVSYEKTSRLRPELIRKE